jgi:hypothetical protein
MDTLNELESDLARIFHLKDSNELLIGSVEKQAKILALREEPKTKLSFPCFLIEISVLFEL